MSLHVSVNQTFRHNASYMVIVIASLDITAIIIDKCDC